MQKLMCILLGLLCSSVLYAAEPIVYTEEKLGITVSSDDPEFTIKLRSNATTGFAWFLRKYDHSILQPVRHVYQAPLTQINGAPGYEVWTFKVKPEGFTVPQQSTLPFVYARPWESGGDVKVLVFRVNTRE